MRKLTAFLLRNELKIHTVNFVLLSTGILLALLAADVFSKPIENTFVSEFRKQEACPVWQAEQKRLLRKHGFYHVIIYEEGSEPYYNKEGKKCWLK